MDATINAILYQCLKALPFIKGLIHNFNLLLKNNLECSFVSSECSLQSSIVGTNFKTNIGTLQRTFRTYKRTFGVIFQKQIEIESKDKQRLAIVPLLKGKGHFAFTGIFFTNFFGAIGITKTIHL